MWEGKKRENIIATKSHAFALQVISVYKNLIAEKKEFVMARQLLKSGTSIGANIYEAICAESVRDFVHKLSIALKEARETSYWLKLLNDSNFISEGIFIKLNNDCDELIRILTRIILTTKAKYFAKN